MFRKLFSTKTIWSRKLFWFENYFSFENYLVRKLFSFESYFGSKTILVSKTMWYENYLVSKTIQVRKLFVSKTIVRKNENSYCDSVVYNIELLVLKLSKIQFDPKYYSTRVSGEISSLRTEIYSERRIQLYLKLQLYHSIGHLA